MGTTCTTLQHIEKEQVNRFGKPSQSKVFQNDFFKHLKINGLIFFNRRKVIQNVQLSTYFLIFATSKRWSLQPSKVVKT